MPYANPPAPRNALLVLLAIAGCASSPAPSPATPVDDARASIEQRLTPERDQINHLGQPTEQGYTGNTSRLSGHFEVPALDGRYNVKRQLRAINAPQ